MQRMRCSDSPRGDFACNTLFPPHDPNRRCSPSNSPEVLEALRTMIPSVASWQAGRVFTRSRRFLGIRLRVTAPAPRLFLSMLVSWYESSITVNGRVPSVDVDDTTPYCVCCAYTRSELVLKFACVLAHVWPCHRTLDGHRYCRGSFPGRRVTGQFTTI